MAGFNLTTAQPLMKIAYNPRIAKQFNTAAVLYNRFYEGKGTPISNRGLEIPTHIGPNASLAWPIDGGTLPTGGSQALVSANIGFFNFSIAALFTGAALDAAGKDAVTYATALTFNIRNTTLDAIKYLNIYSFLDGTGILALVGATVTLSTTTNTTVDVSATADGARYLRIGMPIDFQQGSTSTARQTGCSVNSIPAGPDQAATQISVAPAPAATQLSVNDAVVVSGSFGSVMQGLKLIVDNGTLGSTFQSVSRSTNPQYNGNVIALSGSPALSKDHLRRAIALIQIARGEVNPSGLEFWTHPAQLHAYADMGWPLKRFQGGSALKMDLGFTAYDFEGVPWIIDTDHPKDHIFLLYRPAMFKVTARELAFDDRAGTILRQTVTSGGVLQDQYVAFLIARLNTGSYTPNDNTKVNGLGIPTGY